MRHNERVGKGKGSAVPGAVEGVGDLKVGRLGSDLKGAWQGCGSPVDNGGLLIRERLAGKGGLLKGTCKKLHQLYEPGLCSSLGRHRVLWVLVACTLSPLPSTDFRSRANPTLVAGAPERKSVQASSKRSGRSNYQVARKGWRSDSGSFGSVATGKEGRRAD